jgi:hypothetical protein
MTPEIQTRIAELEREKRIIELERERAEIADTKMSYDEATKGDVAAELGRSGVRGGGYAAEFIGDAYDVGRAAFDQFIPGAEDRSVLDALNPFAPADKGDIARQQLIEDTGLDKWGEEKIRRGDNAWLDAGKTAIEYVLPTLTGGPVGGLKHMAKQVVATSLGAAGGEAIGNQWNETGGTIGEIIGAVSGGLSVNTLMRAGKNLLARHRGKNSVLSEEGLENALAAIMQQADDPLVAKEAFFTAIKKGDAGTMADMMADAGVYNTEALARKGTIAERGIQTAQQERQAQMVGRVEDVAGAGDPTRLPGLAQTMQAKGVSRIDQGRYAAQKKAADLRTDVLVDTPVSEQSTKLANTYTNLDQTRRKLDVKPFWKIFDDAGDIATPDMAGKIDRKLAKFDDIDEIPIRREFADEITALKNMGETTSPAALHKIISRAKAKAADRTQPASNYQRQMDEVMGTFEDMLVDVPGYTLARKAERAHQQRVNPGGVGEARRKTRDTPGLFMTTLKKDLEKGSVTAAEIKQAKSPAVEKAFEDTMRAMANRALETPTGLASFLRKHDELLASFPKLRKDLTALRSAEDVATATVKQTPKSKKRLYSRLVNDMVDEPNKTLDKILKSETAATDLKGLMKQFGKSPDGKAAMQRAVVDRFITTAKGTDDVIKPRVVADFKNVRESLVSSGVLTLDEADTIATVLNMTDAGKLRGGAAAQSLGDDMGTGFKLGTSALAGMVMKIVPGNSLILAGAAKTFMKDMMLKNPTPELTAALETMVSNPRKFEAAMRKYNPKTARDMKTMLAAILKDVHDWTSGPTVPATMVVSGGKDEQRGKY